MRSKMYVLASVALVAYVVGFDLSPVSAQSKKDQVLVGTWDITGYSSDGQQFPPALAVFEIKNGKLTGYYEDDEERAEVREIKWKKDEITFVVTIEAGEYTDIYATAKFESPTKMSGKTSSDILGEGTFIGVKRKKDKD